MTEVYFITLEDNKECIVVDEIIYNNQKYLFLVNSQNNNDFTIRKEINSELIGLNDDIEFDNVMLLFTKKRLKDLKI